MWEKTFGLFNSILGSNGPDKWMWRGVKGDEFFVADARRIIGKDLEPISGSMIGWVKWIPKKCLVFMWQAVLNMIPTRTELTKRGIHVSSCSCSLCGLAPETANHLFSSCEVAGHIWSLFESWTSVPSGVCSSVFELSRLHLTASLPQGKKEAVQGLVITICWRLWKAGNDLVFSNIPVRIVDIVSDIMALGFFWYKNRHRLKPVFGQIGVLSV
ncbi:uncharacterized protein LOC143610930 [Bidens hawaiensis]|uniref:uncharacterized protein LOC143610930 n=1 Tax=Bidens hawaiensis TaxID=980011 RepID=UPI00404B7904